MRITCADGARAPATPTPSAPAARRWWRCCATISRRCSSARDADRGRGDLEATCSSTPTRPPSARSPASRWRRSTPRCGTALPARRAAAVAGWRAARSARVPVYTHRGRLAAPPAADELVDETLRRRREGFRGAKLKVGKPAIGRGRRAGSPPCARRSASDFEIMVDANQASPSPRRCAARGRTRRCNLAWFEEPLPAEDLGGHVRARRAARRCRSPSASRCTRPRTSASTSSGAPARSCRSTRADRRHHAVAQGGAPRRDIQRRRCARTS